MPRRRGNERMNLVGHRYGMLSVLEYAGHSNTRGFVWLCRCDCGGEILRSTALLRRPGTSSCGCFRGTWTKTHGMSQSSVYKIWSNIKKRCFDPRNTSYADYGGRGIVMCDGWRRSAASFLRDVGDRPSDSHSLDRRNNNAGYSCGHCKECVSKKWVANCRWATYSEQAKNTRRTRMITHNGRTQCLLDWARELGLSHHCIGKRLTMGMTAEEALAQKNYGAHMISHEGETLSLKRWAERTGIRMATICQRLGYGWSVERTLSESADRRKYYTAHGRTQSLKDWAAELDVTVAALVTRLHTGWPVEEALSPRKKFSKRKRPPTPRGQRFCCNGVTATLTEWADRTGIKRATICARLQDGWPLQKALSAPVDTSKWQARRRSQPAKPA
jgi:hypothetical protein